MKPLLVINASGRSTRSITRQLTGRFATAWTARQPGGKIITRDVGLNPPPPINESWIAAAFTPTEEQTASIRETLDISNTLIDELFQATAIVLGVPMYNFGMPAQLKAYVDQIVRVGRTFSYGAGGSYQPLVPAKPVTIITATGAAGYEPDGLLARVNFLEPHLEAIFQFLGLADISFVRVGSAEREDGQLKQAMAGAELAIEQIVDRIAA
jgi:FMN-dependent NADH-azoreductase